MSNLYNSGATATTLSLQELIQAAEMLQVSGKHEEAANLYRQWHDNNANKSTRRMALRS